MGGILFSDDPDAVRVKDLGLRILKKISFMPAPASWPRFSRSTPTSG
jgi:hypothetical protein